MLARIDKQGWIRCGQCGHKLGRTVGAWSEMQAMPAIETKCHVCKSINYIMIGRQGGERNE